MEKIKKEMENKGYQVIFDSKQKENDLIIKGKECCLVELFQLEKLLFFSIYDQNDEDKGISEELFRFIILLLYHYAKENQFILYLSYKEIQEVCKEFNYKSVVETLDFISIEKEMLLKDYVRFDVSTNDYIHKSDVKRYETTIKLSMILLNKYQSLTKNLSLFETTEKYFLMFDFYYQGFFGTLVIYVKEEEITFVIEEENDTKMTFTSSVEEIEATMNTIFSSIEQKTRLKKIFEEQTYFFDQLFENNIITRDFYTRKRKIYEFLRQTYTSHEIEEWSFHHSKRRLVLSLNHYEVLFSFKDLYLHINFQNNTIHALEKSNKIIDDLTHSFAENLKEALHKMR